MFRNYLPVALQSEIYPLSPNPSRKASNTVSRKTSINTSINTSTSVKNNSQTSNQLIEEDEKRKKDSSFINVEQTNGGPTWKSKVSVKKIIAMKQVLC